MEARGFVPDDAGVAVDGAVINVYAEGTATPSLADAKTGSNGEWAIGASLAGANGTSSVQFTTLGRFDLKITNGASITWLRGFDRLGVEVVQANSETTAIEAGHFTSSTDESSTLLMVYEGDRATPADGDAMFFSYKMSDSGGNQEEVARITVKQNDINPSADGEWLLQVAQAGSLIDAIKVSVNAAGVLTTTITGQAASARFATGTYSGDGTESQAITGVGFQVVYLIIVERETADAQGMTVIWTTDTIIDDNAAGMAVRVTTAATSAINAIIALGADGFTVDDNAVDDDPNKNGVTYNYIAFG